MSQSSSIRDQESDEVAKLLVRIGDLLDDQKPKEALELITRAKSNSPWLTNAVGVAQMRQGNHDIAVEVFRRLALGPGGLVLSNDVPPVFLTNFATALLAAQNIGGGLGVLSQLDNVRHPAVKRLNDSVAKWQANMSFWQKIKFRVGGVSTPLQLDFPLGDLE